MQNQKHKRRKGVACKCELSTSQGGKVFLDVAEMKADNYHFYLARCHSRTQLPPAKQLEYTALIRKCPGWILNCDPETCASQCLV